MQFPCFSFLFECGKTWLFHWLAIIQEYDILQIFCESREKKKAWYWFICLWTIQFIFYSLKNTQHYSIFSRLFPKTHHQLSLVLGTEKKKNWKLEDLFQEFFQNPLSTRFKLSSWWQNFYWIVLYIVMN